MLHPRCTSLGQQRPARHSDVARGGRYTNCPFLWRPAICKWNRVSVHMQGKVPSCFCRASARLPKCQQLALQPRRQSPVHTCSVQGAALCIHLVSVEVPAEMLQRETSEAGKWEWQAAQGLRLQGHLGQEEKELCCTGRPKGGVCKPSAKQKSC